MGHIKINSYTVILYLEGLGRWQDVLPMKNALHSLCKVIKSHGPDPRIFLANHLPRPTASPIRIPVDRFNFTLQQAVRSVGRAMGKVFELSIHEHFILHNGKVIRPVYRYFAGDGSLSALGCMVFWECALREADLKTYWFK